MFRIMKVTRAQAAERPLYTVRDSILSFIRSLDYNCNKTVCFALVCTPARLCAVAEEIRMHKSLQQGELSRLEYSLFDNVKCLWRGTPVINIHKKSVSTGRLSRRNKEFIEKITVYHFGLYRILMILHTAPSV